MLSPWRHKSLDKICNPLFIFDKMWVTFCAYLTRAYSRLSSKFHAQQARHSFLSSFFKSGKLCLLKQYERCSPFMRKSSLCWFLTGFFTEQLQHTKCTWCLTPHGWFTQFKHMSSLSLICDFVLFSQIDFSAKVVLTVTVFRCRNVSVSYIRDKGKGFHFCKRRLKTVNNMKHMASVRGIVVQRLLS